MCVFLKRIALHAAIGMEEWLGGPEALPWQVSVPCSYLHANVCALLGIIFIRKIPEGRIYCLATSAFLLWSGFGAAGTLFFALFFASLEAYNSLGCPFSVPRCIQQALVRWLAGWLTPIKLAAMRNLQKLQHYMREAQEGMSVALGLSAPLVSCPCRVAGIQR